jgi:RNA polymerase sigma-70 factor (ECF subfamily)
VEEQLTGVLNLDLRALDADTELMLRFQAGEAECFDQLVTRHRRGVLNFIGRMVQDSAIGEELAQETFLRVYLSRDRYTPKAKFTTWLYRIASHLALNHLRDHKHDRRTESLDETDEEGHTPVQEFSDQRPGAEARLLEEERQAFIRRAIAKLPERQRAAVIMHKYQGLGYQEIGGALELSESATKSLLFRAYEALRKELRPLLQNGEVLS